ncbi:MAG TPA: RDD family protein [Solirubrobacteraceae bacterium]|nr:RDD family protein [Solirubrobacteraceae bacterium]
MSTNGTFSWGAESLSRGGRRRRERNVSRRGSLLGSRAAAVFIDGLVLLVPVLAIAYLLSIVFPHHGFFRSHSESGSSTSFEFRLGLPGALLVSALSLSYFFLCECLFGQTIGKRRMGLCVRSSAGGAAGLNAISARTVLRLVDGLGLYLLGALVAILTGARRRRIGDWLGGTVVVRDDGGLEDPPRHELWRVLAYPVSWVLAVIVATFALGLGDAVGADEQALSLVQSYVRAREHGDAALACSMLSREQQRELVALQTNDYRAASGARCPAFILRSETNSRLLNPALPELVAGPLTARYSPLGAVLVSSADVPDVALPAIYEGGRLKLDVRALQRVEFVRGCVQAGRLSAGECGCAFAELREEGLLESVFTERAQVAIRENRARCTRGRAG